MDKDDVLLKRLFDQQKKMVVEDNGFSRRIMERLPHRSIFPWATLWNVLCSGAAIVLFISLDGFRLLWESLHEVFTQMAANNSLLAIDPKVWMVAGAVLLCLFYHKLMQLT